jgi:hypothetical protein
MQMYEFREHKILPLPFAGPYLLLSIFYNKELQFLGGPSRMLAWPHHIVDAPDCHAGGHHSPFLEPTLIVIRDPLPP